MNSFKLILFLVFYLVSLFSFCQNQKKIDSLFLIVKSSDKDSLKMNALNEIAYEQRINQQNEAFENINKAIEIGEKSGCTNSLAYSYRVAALIYYYRSDYSNALLQSQKSYKLYNKIKNKKGASDALNLIAVIYSNQKFFDNAIEMYKKSLELRTELKDYQGMAGSNNNIGLCYFKKQNYDSAFLYYNRAVNISENIKDQQSLGMYYSNVGKIYQKKKLADKWYEYLMKSYKVRIKINDKQQLSNIFESLGEYYLETGNITAAVENLEKSLSYAKEIKIAFEIESVTKILSKAYAAIGLFDKAYKTLLYNNHINDSIKKQDVALLITRIELQTKFEKEQEIDRLKNEKKELENQKKLSHQKFIRNTFIIICIAIGLIAVLLLKNYRQKKKDNLLLEEKNDLLITQKEEILQMNAELQTQKEEIEAQRDNLEILNSELLQKNEEISSQRDEIESQRMLVTNQKEKIEEIHHELKSSIIYAKRIQDAILPSEEYLNKILKNYFILYKPRDIVSGDFYFISQRNNWLMIAVADCTGHGVPGAFMSMLGISFLNEIVAREEIQTAADVLNELRNGIIFSLKQKTSEKMHDTSSLHTIKDGMDIALCVLNTETLELQFAGANNPIWIVPSPHTSDTLSASGTMLVEIKGDSSPDSLTTKSLSLIEIKGDKQPIGIYEKMNPFSNQKIQLAKGDTLYLLSDGFADQFGGPLRKKFLSKNIKKIIEENYKKPMEIQKQIFEKTLIKWIAEEEQIDDITLVGVKI